MCVTLGSCEERLLMAFWSVQTDYLTSESLGLISG